MFCSLPGVFSLLPACLPSSHQLRCHFRMSAFPRPEQTLFYILPLYIHPSPNLECFVMVICMIIWLVSVCTPRPGLHHPKKQGLSLLGTCFISHSGTHRALDSNTFEEILYYALPSDIFVALFDFGSTVHS